MIEKPYVGLRPFERDEHEIFFGREKCVDELLDLLPNSNFFAVIGDAYCGKTSLVRCGLEARLLQNNDAESIVHWHIANFRPNIHPFFQFADSLLKPEALGDFFLTEFENFNTAQYFVRQNLIQSSLSLHTLLDRNPLPKGHKLLLVCDQFEEIFHIWQQDKEKAEKFINLLLDSSKPPLKEISVHNIHVVIIMRSAYLDKVALFPKLEDSLRNNIYLTPRLKKEHLKAAIIKPALIIKSKQKINQEKEADDHKPQVKNKDKDKTPNAIDEINRVYENSVVESPTAETQSNTLENNEIKNNPDTEKEQTHVVSPELVEHLLEIVDAKNDQLPLLQYLLMRLWELAILTQDHNLTMDLFKKPRIGSFEEALSHHLEETYDSLKEQQPQIAEILFRKLMTIRDDSRPRLLHNPVKLKDVVQLANTSIEEVIKVIDIFRNPERTFLNPPHPIDLKSDTLIEISHESIVRHWQRLKDWKDQEIQANENYHQLDVLAHKHYEENGEMLKQPLLNKLWQWYKDEQFNEAWAQHYGCNFHIGKSYLLKSKAYYTGFSCLKIIIFICVVIGSIYFLTTSNQNDSKQDKTLNVLYEMREELITPQNSHKLEPIFKNWTKNDADNINAWLYYGLSLSYQQKWNEAENVFRRVYKISPKNHKILFNLAKVLVDKPDKQADEAIKLLEKALKENPEDTDVLQYLGYLLSHQDELKEAKKKQKQRIQKAIGYYQKFLSITPKNDKVLSELGKLLSLQNKNKKAFEYLNKAVKVNKNSVENWRILGLIEMEKGSIDNAIKDLENALSLAPDDDKNWRNLGRAELKKGNLSKATEAFEKAIRINKNKDNDKNYKLLGDVFMQRNRLEEALTAYNKALDIKITKETLMKKSQLLAKQNKMNEARIVSQQALSIEDSNWE